MPVGQFDAGEQFRRQSRATAFVALGRQRQGEIRAGQGGGQVQADMAMAQLMADQRRGEQQQRRVLVIQFEAEAGQGAVQRTQPAMFDPGVEQRQETLRVLQLGQRRGRLVQQGQLFAHALTSSSWPLNSASRASISSRGGRAR